MAAAATVEATTVRARNLRPSVRLLLRPAAAPATLHDLGLMRMHPSTASLPVVLLTPVASPPDVVKMLKSGVSEVFISPGTLATFSERFNATVGTSAASP